MHSASNVVPHVSQAFILAHDVPDFKDRIRSMFFLSTPHQGTDLASTLKNVLAVSSFSSHHYLNDLSTKSVSIRLLNDDFGRLARDLPIVSFYETLKTSIGLSSIIVVDRDSAVLGRCLTSEWIVLFFLLFGSNVRITRLYQFQARPT